MSFFRVTSDATAVPIPDLGVSIPSGSTVVLSSQFSVNDLFLSADLEALIINSDLAVEIDYGTGFSAILAADYTNRDCLAAFLNVYEISNENNNEKLVDGSEVNAAGPAGAALHIHDARYYTQAVLGASTGAALIGVDDANFDFITGTNVQDVLDSIDDFFGTSLTLDGAYDNDPDGILDVDGSTKPLNFRSDGANDVLISRKISGDVQNAVLLDVSADEVILGALAAGALAQLNVRVKSNLIVDGNVTFTGTVTDTTVDTLNVTNANIRLRDSATGIAAADAFIEVERGTSGADAQLYWDETAGRWKAGLAASVQTIALLEASEVVSGIWEFAGGGSSDPSLYLTDKSAAPTTNLGTSGQIPLTSILNVPAYYDKGRSKWVSMYREHLSFSGRDNANNANEYMRHGMFTSNQSSARLLRNMVLIGISAQSNGAETWTVRVRKNGVATNLASLAISAATGAVQTNTNINFDASDKIEVYCDGTSVDRPLVRLEFAQRF